MNICTHGDINYLGKILALHHSLKETAGDFVLHVLCNDTETFESLFDRAIPEMRLYSLGDYEMDDAQLSEVKNFPAGTYGSQRDNYLWKITPYFVNEILQIIPYDETLIYVDSDVYFYQSPQIILDAVGNRSVGIHTHRFTPPYRKTASGWFNVGAITFRKDEIGIRMAEQWKEWCMTTGTPLHDEYGTCGDQLWLQIFYKIIGWENISIFDEEEAWKGYCHLAPWNAEQFDGTLVFYHFSHFNMDSNGWKDAHHNEWHPAKKPGIHDLYENYYQTIKSLL